MIYDNLIRLWQSNNGSSNYNNTPTSILPWSLQWYMIISVTWNT